MQKKQHTSNRTQRRAAERAALKSARKGQPLPLAVETSKALVATASDHQNHMPNDGFADINVGTFHQSEPPHHLGNPGRTGGPRTEAGKQTSSRNALKHGGCSVTTLILESENFEDFQALEAEVFESFKLDPDDPGANKGEIALIREAVRANWFYRRSENNYSETEGAMLNQAPNTLMWGEDHHRTLGRFQRYKTAAYNLLLKARKAVDDYRKARLREAAEIAKIQHADQKLAISKDRLEIYRLKNKPFDFDEEIEAMTQKAIRLGFRDPDPEPDDTQDFAPVGE